MKSSHSFDHLGFVGMSFNEREEFVVAIRNYSDRGRRSRPVLWQVDVDGNISPFE